MRPCAVPPWKILTIELYGIRRVLGLESKSHALGFGLGNYNVGANCNLVGIKEALANVQHFLKSRSVRAKQSQPPGHQHSHEDHKSEDQFSNQDLNFS